MALIIKAECIVPLLPCTESVFRGDDHPNRDAGFKNHNFQTNLPDEDCTQPCYFPLPLNPIAQKLK
jgi:hypothetical protein